MKSRKSPTSSSPRGSSGSIRQASDLEFLDQLDWNSLYDRLDKLIKRLILPNESLESFAQAIDSARKVEGALVQLYGRISRYLADAKQMLDQVKVTFKVKTKLLLADPEYLSNSTQTDRKMFAEAYLIDEQKSVDTWDDRVNRLKLFQDCVSKALSTAKHHREDIGKRLRVIEVQRELGET